MTSLIVHCDRCGERIESGRTLAIVETGPLRARWPTLDLCTTCADALTAWLVEKTAPTTEVSCE